MFVYGDHAEVNISCKSRNGFMIFLNMSLAQQESKKQSKVETSVFGAEFVAMRQGL